MTERAHPTGSRCWLVPDAFLPGASGRGAISHEAVCVLNTGSEAARLRLTFYFEDREPDQSRELVVEGRRTWHIRLDDAGALGLELPVDTPFAYQVDSDEPVTVQHSRLDTSHGGYTLATTAAIPGR
ncbi:hypothetical protein ER308_11900 [Egibacter rhizosphaerae]|uniref:Sensory rhodopsin transducer n=1 Tax=Egibacter rhizosphaerae TaxID=1670831 RepID=A0A411YG94_9ACTN|nr:sensory rhodopsin transducer [Egibacter rhizosphaerae]QBI20199.1 hypothetical protein ER308_11900 [Egibacter rhizosphaerae]